MIATTPMLPQLPLEALHLTALTTDLWTIDTWSPGQPSKIFEELARLPTMFAHAGKSSTNHSAIGLASGYPLKNELGHINT